MLFRSVPVVRDDGFLHSVACLLLAKRAMYVLSQLVMSPSVYWSSTGSVVHTNACSSQVDFFLRISQVDLASVT